LKYDEKQVEFF